jgi:iron complex outermembrane recepter protein
VFRKNKHHRTFALLVAIAGASISAFASAQYLGSQPEGSGSSAKSSNTDLSEIVVTGEKRDIKLIDTPASVAVFDSAKIESTGIVAPSDFVLQTSNVTFTTVVNPGDFLVNIRGVSSIRGGEPAVAIIIDGVPVADSSEVNTALFALEQIEVLKGPEGAYWGRDAAAGAIIITTKKPTEELSGETLFSYGNDNSYDVTTTVSQALIPGALSARLSASIHGTDGSYTNPITDEKSQRFEEQSARLRLHYDVGGALTADYSLTGINGKGGSDAFIAKISQTPLSPNGTIVGGVPVTNVSPNSTLTVPFVSDVPGRYQRQVVSQGMVVGYDLGTSQLTSITGYHDTHDYDGGKNFPYGNAANSTTDFYGWQAVFGDKTQYESHLYTQWDEELRLTSEGSHRIDWQIGMQFVQNREDFIQQNTLDGAIPPGLAAAALNGYGGYNAAGVRTLVGAGTALPFPLGITPLNSAYPTTAYNDKELVGTNYSPFGSATMNLSDALKLRAAIRYDTEVRHVNDQTPDEPDPFTGDTSYNNCVTLLHETSAQCFQGLGKTFHEWQPKVTLDYKIGGASSIYASYGIGFKTGGFNGIGTRQKALLGYIGAYEALGQSPSDAAANATKAVYTQDVYDKEVDTTYEIGAKSDLFDHRLYISSAVFLTETSNAQYYDFDPVSYVESINSIDRVQTKGAEIEADYKLTDALTLFANYGYIDPKIKKFAAAPQDVGNFVPQVSLETFDGGIQVSEPITAGRSISARVDYAWTGATYYTIDNLSEYERTPFGLLNARIGISSDRWDLTLWGKNIMNQRYASDVTAILEPYSTALDYGQLMTWGIDLRMRF